MPLVDYVELYGLVVAFCAGWLGALAPASDAIEGITFIGFVAFFF